ncbi:hypothetical protein HY629_02535 [Candidatus Uhrbacteria bacterium]|nr:hypothetical protein [Candidatus Uhrbacteria bacterium]
MQTSLSFVRVTSIGVLLLILVSLFVALPLTTHAQDFNTIVGAGVNGAAGNSGLSNKPLMASVGGLINIFLGILGTVAVVIVIYGGFLWMTASGNTEQVEKAQKLLVQGLIGFVIIALAWSIASFVVSNIGKAV